MQKFPHILWQFLWHPDLIPGENLRKGHFYQFVVFDPDRNPLIQRSLVYALQAITENLL